MINNLGFFVNKHRFYQRMTQMEGFMGNSMASNLKTIEIEENLNIEQAKERRG